MDLRIQLRSSRGTGTRRAPHPVHARRRRQAERPRGLHVAARVGIWAVSDGTRSGTSPRLGSAACLKCCTSPRSPQSPRCAARRPLPGAPGEPGEPGRTGPLAAAGTWGLAADLPSNPVNACGQRPSRSRSGCGSGALGAAGRTGGNRTTGGHRSVLPPATGGGVGALGVIGRDPVGVVGGLGCGVVPRAGRLRSTLPRGWSLRRPVRPFSGTPHAATWPLARQPGPSRGNLAPRAARCPEGDPHAAPATR
jgi:hypothetical protein